MTERVLPSLHMPVVLMPRVHAACSYFMYSSDHGFQLGELNIAMDKRHVYDWDTRIHLLVRGKYFQFWWCCAL